MLRFREIIIIAAVVVATAFDLVYAAGPTTNEHKNEFLVKKWTIEEGLPQNTVTCIVQTSDGYFWLGTLGGLARFDGVKFTIFDSTNAPDLASNRILSLYEDRWKRLWIGAETGEVYVYQENKFTELKAFSDFKRLTVWQFLEDGDGGFYISSDSGLEKVTFDEQGLVVPGSEMVLTRERSYKLAKSQGGQVWALIQGSAFVVENGKLLSAESKGLLLPRDLLKFDVRDDGKMSVSSNTGLGNLEGETFTELLKLDPAVHLASFATGTRANEIWLQQANELYEFHGENTIKHNIGDYVTGGSRAVFFDTEGNIWLATNADGLVRLTRRNIALLSDIGNFETVDSYCIAEAPDGTVWVGGLDLLKVKDGNVESVKRPTRSGASPQFVKALAFDLDGTMWIGGSEGLSVMRNEVIASVPQFGTRLVHSIFFDRDSVMWGGGPDGLWNFRDNKFTHFTTSDGLADNSIHYITQTRDDSIWIGSRSGLNILKDGKFESFTSDHGLSGKYVREIVEDADGTMWIGTYGGGINRLRDGRIDAITTANGLHDNYVSRILIDDAGKFWILSNHGIFAVSRDELNAVADKRKNFIIGSTYGVSDGMKSSEANGGHQSAGIKTRDGRLWFPMIKDVVIIDPKKDIQTPPKVVIERVTTRPDVARSQPVAAIDIERNSISIPTGQRDLEIQFTGLSFSKPEDIRFYYKMAGTDGDWTDAGTRRTAFYPYLPSGDYTFQVRAVSASGVMSENTAFLNITVAKFFWQTWWFTAAVFLAAIFVGLVFYRYKADQIEARRLRDIEFAKQLLNAQERERGRIATELHDGLGQNLLILRNWAQLGLDASESPVEVREHLLQISESAAQSIDETRAIVRNLSPQNLRRFGLTEAIRNMAEQLQSSTGVLFECSIENIDGLFTDETELSIYRIVQECLNNIVKHSESPRGSVSIERRDAEISIVVADYGKGFSANQYLGSAPQTRGFGVRSIIQRVQLLGGEVIFDSRVSAGTTIRLRFRK